MFRRPPLFREWENWPILELAELHIGPAKGDLSQSLDGFWKRLGRAKVQRPFFGLSVTAFSYISRLLAFS